MDQNCAECEKKDQKIKALKQRISELEQKMKNFGSELSKVKVLDENSYKLLQENIKKAIGDLIFQGSKQNQAKSFIQRTQTDNLSEIQKQLQQDEQHNQLGQRFFEHFLIVGPDIEELKQVNENINEIRVKPKILYQFPNIDEYHYDVVPFYSFPNGVLAKRLQANAQNFKEKILPELKQIIMQTQQQTNGENEYCLTIPREDIQENSRMKISEFAQQSNPNVFRYIICFEINEFICLDPKTYSCWLCPIVHCFVSYYPFIKFFQRENANIWNQLKLERIVPCLFESQSHEVFEKDFLFMKNKLNSVISNRLFSLRSIQITYDKKYQLNDMQFKTPNKDNAQLLSFLWGCNKTFQILSFEELIYLISHVILCQRVILFSKKKSVLSHIMLTIIFLIQPFNYKLPFCILIPDELLDRVAAPCPFFFGVVGEYENYSQRIEEAQQEDVTLFDLNLKRVYFSKSQSRDLNQQIIPLIKNSRLKQLYNLINNSKVNAFNNGNKQLQQLEKCCSSNSMFENNKDQYQQLLKDIAKQFQTYFYSNLAQYIPVDKKFIKTGTKATLDFQLLQKNMLSKCPKDSKKFIKELIQNPTFTGYLDELYEFIYQQNS